MRCIVAFHRPAGLAMPVEIACCIPAAKYPTLRYVTTGKAAVADVRRGPKVPELVMRQRRGPGDAHSVCNSHSASLTRERKHG